MTRTEALQTVLEKWNTNPPKPHEHGDCIQICVDYATARWGWQDRFSFTRDEELNVKNVMRLFGRPTKDGEICLFKNGASVIMLPYGGVMGSFVEVGHFARLVYEPPEGSLYFLGE